MAALTVQIDTQEPRILTDRMAVLVTGQKAGKLQWDLQTWPGAVDQAVSIDEATFTAILVPIWETPAWYTTARTPFLIRKADTDKAASASWIEKNLSFDGNVHLHALGVNQVVTTIASFEKNMPWWVSYYAYGQGDQFAQLEVRFGTGGAQVNLLFYTDNNVHIFKGGVFQGTVNLSRSRAWERAARATEGSERANNQNQPIDIFILPCRNRELIIYSSAGGTGNFVFPDIERDDPNPTILPAGTVAFWQAEGQATFQAAPAKKSGAAGNFFATSGYLLSQIVELRQPPAIAAVATCEAFWNDPGYDTLPTIVPSLVDTDGVTPFVGNGTKKQCRLKIAATGNGTNTPFVYGGQAVFDAVTQNTPNSPTTVDDYHVEGELSVPESPADVVLDVKLLNAVAVDAILSKSKKISNRPMVAKIGTIAIMTGRTRSPSWTDSPIDALQALDFECQDRWKAFERKRIADPLPYDGRLLSDVIKELAMSPGYPAADMDVEAFGLTLDATEQASKGEWALIPSEGDTVAQWIMRLYEDYARTCFVGWYPSATGPKFRFRLPAEYGGTLSTTETATVYSTRAAAIAAGWTEANAHLHVYGEFEEEWAEPEANDVRVTGYDSRLDLAFQAHEEDAAAKDPDVAVASRPDNWAGEPWEVALWDPAIKTQAMATYAAGVMRYRTFTSRRPAQWPCQMQFKVDDSPIWRGDVMRLNGHGRYRVIAMYVPFILENASRQWRPASYIGEYVGA